MKIPATFFLIIIHSLIAFPQHNFKDLKKKLEQRKIKEVLTDSKIVTNLRNTQITKDTSTFNYSVSLIDNTSFFKSKENKQNFALTVLKKSDHKNDFQITRSEHAFDLNRNASVLFKMKRYRLAMLQYFNALSLYSNQELTPVEISQILSQNDLDKRITDKYNSFEGLVKEDHFAVSHTLNNLSALFLLKGDIAHAEKFANASMVIRETHLGNQHLSLASSWNNMGNILKEKGDFFEAEVYYQKSLTLLKKKNYVQHVYYAIVKNNIATLYHLLGNYTEAGKHYKSAIAIAQNYEENQDALHRNNEIINFETNYAILLFAQDEIDNSEKKFQSVLRKTAKTFGKRSPEYAYLLNNYASVKMAQNNLDEAISYVKDALDIYASKFSENHHTYLKTRLHLAKVYYLQRNYFQSRNIMEHVGPKLKSVVSDNHPERLTYIADYALVLWKIGEIEEANKLFKHVLKKSFKIANDYFHHMTENERAKFWFLLRERLMDYFAFCTENSMTYPEYLEQMYSAHIKTKGLILSSSQSLRKKILQSNDEALINTFQEWINLKELLAVYISWPNERIEEEEINLDSLQTLSNSKEEILSQKIDLLSAINEKSNWKHVQESLSETEAGIEIIRIHTYNSVPQDQYVVLINTRKNGIEMVKLQNAIDLEERYFTFYYNAIQNNIESDTSYNSFWKPIEKLLEGYKTLYVSTDGVYNKINLNTLKKPNGSYLIENNTIINVSNTAYIKDIKSRKNINLSNVSLFGGAYFGKKGKISPLPGTKQEVESISASLKGKNIASTLYVGTRASEENVKHQFSPSILHIATHGFFEDDTKLSSKKSLYGLPVSAIKDNPLLRSGLLLANAEKEIDEKNGFSNQNNGILLSYEIANNLMLDNTDLVVLSACETAKGDIKNGEGVYGLQRAFQLAGAQTLIMSLWKVNDESTKELMIEFYKELIQRNDKIKALRAAQLKVMQQYPEPAYWGGFVLLL